MNKKQKVLTIFGMILFLIIGVLGLTPPTVFEGVYTAWFMLAVVYAGLFFVLK
jgi:hypothetical protein